MATKKIQYVTPTGLTKEVYAKADEPVTVSTSTDEVEHSTIIMSPNYRTAYDHTGGRPKNPRDLI